jgi:hypothetical protein
MLWGSFIKWKEWIWNKNYAYSLDVMKGILSMGIQEHYDRFVRKIKIKIKIKN